VGREVKLSELPKEVVPIIIVQEGKLNPFFTRDTVLKPGETLIVLGNPDYFREVSRKLSKGE